MGFLLQMRMKLAAHAFERVSVLVLWSWARTVSCLSPRLRRAAARRWSGADAAAGVVSWQSAPVLLSADCACCGGAVSWLCRLRTFFFQPVACQQVVGFCVVIWVYAGVILCGSLLPSFRSLTFLCC